MHETLPPALAVSCCTPAVRLVVVQAETRRAEAGGPLKTEVAMHVVVGVESRVLGDGVVVRSPLIVVGGDVVALDHARLFEWGRSSVDQTCECPGWGHELDPIMLDPVVKDLTRQSLRAEEEFMAADSN